MTSPSDTHPIARTITARVHDNAIARVPKLFADSLAAIFTELLQNARRAEATRLYINTGTTPRITPPNPAAHCITVADDGTGIADPAILLSFGETGWDNATATREDAAGMGIAALARRGCTVHSASRTTPAWRVTLTPAHFLGRESAPVHLTSTTGTQPYPNGTEITFAAPEDLPAITKALTSAARYYPLPVYLNGEQLVRHAFLHDAIHTETWQGATFGVFTHRYPYTNTPDLNFHGLCLNARLPRIDSVAGHTWTVRANVQDCPQLELVLPARNEPVETPFLDNLRQAARAAIYRAIAAASPPPRMAVHRCAESLGTRHRPAVPAPRTPTLAARSRPRPRLAPHRRRLPPDRRRAPAHDRRARAARRPDLPPRRRSRRHRRSPARTPHPV